MDATPVTSPTGSGSRLRWNDYDRVGSVPGGDEGPQPTVERRDAPAVANGEPDQVSVGDLLVTDDAIERHVLRFRETEVIAPESMARERRDPAQERGRFLRRHR